MTRDIHESVVPQLEALPVERGRPLIVSDADEVLTRFIAGLEAYLQTQDLWLDLSSFAISGNIRRRADDSAVPREEVPHILSGFFEEWTEKLDPVEGAAEALRTLSERAQIVVLSNVPHSQREARTRWLQSHKMDYPLVANSGLKGGAVAHLAERAEAPVFFLDDIPHNLESVAKAAGDVHRLHFIADERLARLIGPAKDSHHHTTKWPEAQSFIEDRLKDLGF